MCRTFGHLRAVRLKKWTKTKYFVVYLFIILVITMVDYQRIGNGGTRPATITLSNHSLSESALLPIKHLHQLSKNVVY